MDSSLKLIIFEEKRILQELMNLLDKQYNLILSDEVVALDKVNEDIELIGKNLATIEIKRRDLIKDNNFKEIIENSYDKHLKDVYEEVKGLLRDIELQNDTNSTLIKQRLFFTNKMIDVIKPSKNIGTYNSYGNVR
ncbi:flagellar biosynthesis/type III secretory pathway chaperone [Clostridium moniliforme]|uniref:Flagellar biosynthesis/type III secretory pathway chaperone n=1 Tax=Clostridium moniliforme TaxID=39489 RepID=A0ABS4F1B7_9CLOT|nr:flagellar protein FlgN [Clostridium moniliforme]MBP1890039.1 flagellar biosynthesis/type III secretory pathway chaperone [Clostridium moniliforme]